MVVMEETEKTEDDAAFTEGGEEQGEFFVQFRVFGYDQTEEVENCADDFVCSARRTHQFRQIHLFNSFIYFSKLISILDHC